MEKRERIYYLDIIRGLAVFFMIMQHTMLMFEYGGGDGDGFISGLFVILGTAPAAPMFMIIMGIFIMKSETNNKTFFIRGLKIFLLGYFLNVVRFTAPLSVFGEGEAAKELFFSVDILQMAGLFLMLITPFRKYVSKHWFTPVIIVAVLIISPYLWYDTSNIITDLFVGTSSNVAFPLLPWMCYPLLGMYLSQFVTHPVMNKKVKRNMMLVSIGCAVAGVLLFDMFPHTDYSRYGLGASLLIIAFALMYLVVAETLTKRFNWTDDGKLTGILVFWSKHVTDIYIVSWAIYGWSVPFIGYNARHGIVAMFLGYLVMALTHVLVKRTTIAKLIPSV